MKELEEVKKIFLDNELDEEDRQKNLEDILAWETSLRNNQAFLSWQESDISRNISSKLKSEYRDISVQLSSNRTLTEVQRYSFWAKQDSIKWLLSIIEHDAKSVIDSIEQEIKTILTRI